MADFCKQCSISMFGEDLRDLASIGTGALGEGEGWAVICEGCGPTLVNDEGECIVDDCMEKGHHHPHTFGHHEQLPPPVAT